MSNIHGPTIRMVNELITKHKASEVPTTFTLVTFNDCVMTPQFNVKIEDAHHINFLSYVPNGRTAMYDALGNTIDALGKHLADTPEHLRPGKVLFIILTDGHENASRYFNAEGVRSRIKHQREQYQWEFLFLGANIDAFAVGDALSILRDRTMQYAATEKNVTRMADSIARVSCLYSSNGIAPTFTAHDRSEAVD